MAFFRTKRRQTSPQTTEYFEDTVSRPMRRRYVAALLSIGALTLLAQVCVQTILTSQTDDAELINEAGRQRMRSQAIAKLALLVGRDSDPDSDASQAKRQAIYRTDLETTFETWAGWQARLFRSNGSPAAELLDESERESLLARADPAFEAISTAVADLMRRDDASRDARPEEVAAAVEIILAQEPIYLDAMNTIVDRMSASAKQSVRMMQWIEIAIFIAILFALEMEYLFVFEPAAKVIRRQFASLVEQNRRLSHTDAVQQNNEALRDEIAVRRQVEDDLRAAHSEVKQLSLVASRTQHPIVILGPDTLIDWTNDAFSQHFLYSAAEASKRSLVDLLCARESDKKTLASISRSLKNGLPLTTELQLRRANGSVLWVELSLEPVHDPTCESLAGHDGLCEELVRSAGSHRGLNVELGDPLDEEGTRIESLGDLSVDLPYNVPAGLTIVTLLDISERQRQSASLANAKERAEEANRAKSRFLANMSHEIRTPLNAILGYGELLRKLDADEQVGTSGDSPETAGRYISTINASGRHLLGLINDVLDLSKIEAGRMEFEAQPCPPHRVLCGVTEALKQQAADKGLTLGLDWKTPVPAMIETDAVRLRQLLFNLVGNAVKFTDRGSVRVEASCHVDKSGGCLEIAVIDSGPGMDEHKQQEIFDPFTQGDAARSRDGSAASGTGLGLTISRHIAEGLGGSLTVSSVLGIGSRFTATIDCGDLSNVVMLDPSDLEDIAETEEASTLEFEGPVLAGRHILVCEDGRTNRDLIAIILRDAGAEVSFAENGKIGIDILLGENPPPFDLVLMDMQMPVMGGYEATEVLRRSGVSIPIIALTAYAMRDDRKKCLDAGCDDYATKPIDPAELFRVMQRHLSGSPASASLNAFPSFPGSAVQTTAAAAHRRNPDCPSPSGPIESQLPADMPNREELLGQFIDELSGLVRDLEEAMFEEDWPLVGRTAHAIQGTAGSVGYPCFTQPARRLEEIAKSGGDRDEGRDLVVTLCSYADRVRGVALAS